MSRAGRRRASNDVPAWQASLMAEGLLAFDPEVAVDVRALDEGSPLRAHADEGDRFFTAAVQCLAKFPERIRLLGAAIWEVFHSRTVRLNFPLSPELAGVPTLSFGVVLCRGQEALVFVPKSWLSMSA